MDEGLKDRLAGMGLVPDGNTDAFGLWVRLRSQYGAAVNVIDLYALAAHRRGLQAHELPRAERLQLAKRAQPQMADGFEIVAGSERPEAEPVVIVPYDDAWPHQYLAWKSRLASALGAVAKRIDHVGSTAVPGLAAKPTIDVQVSVEHLEDESKYVPPIEAIGVHLRIRDVEHRYFRPVFGQPRSVHVHVCASGGEWERLHLLFRNYLRASALALAAYTRSKLLAAERWSDDRIAYTDAKDGTIRELISAAEVWASRQAGSDPTTPPPTAG
jgi:GrpB-like predicted nucleotidyltransferase (UPF0157 family)